MSIKYRRQSTARTEIDMRRRIEDKKGSHTASLLDARLLFHISYFATIYIIL